MARLVRVCSHVEAFDDADARVPVRAPSRWQALVRRTDELAAALDGRLAHHAAADAAPHPGPPQRPQRVWRLPSSFRAA